MIPVSTALTSCTSIEDVTPSNDAIQILLDMIPPLPEVPPLPPMTWTFEKGLYCVSETDVDKLLDYGENKLPRFRWELEQYKKQLEIIKTKLGESVFL